MSDGPTGAAAYDEGIRKLESMLAGTRMHATRALKELHERMVADLVEAEHRARRAERRLAKSKARTQQVRIELQQARKRARKAEQRARRPVAKARFGGLGRLGGLVRRVRGRGA